MLRRTVASSTVCQDRINNTQPAVSLNRVRQQNPSKKAAYVARNIHSRMLPEPRRPVTHNCCRHVGDDDDEVVLPVRELVLRLHQVAMCVCVCVCVCVCTIDLGWCRPVLASTTQKNLAQY